MSVAQAEAAVLALDHMRQRRDAERAWQRWRDATQELVDHLLLAGAEKARERHMEAEPVKDMGVAPADKMGLLLRIERGSAAACEFRLGGRRAEGIELGHAGCRQGTDGRAVPLGHEREEPSDAGRHKTRGFGDPQAGGERCDGLPELRLILALDQPERGLERRVEPVATGFPGKRDERRVELRHLATGLEVPAEPPRAPGRKIAFGHPVDRMTDE